MTIDSLLASVVADSMTKRKHNSNRELIGQGLVILQDLLSAACRVPMAMAIIWVSMGFKTITTLHCILHGNTWEN
jgi:SulP family sulfate permease